MRRGLYSKMVATLTLIIAISFIVIATILSFWFEGYYFEQKKKQLVNAAAIIETYAIARFDNNITSDRFSDLLNETSKYFNTDILLIDNYGYVYEVSSDKMKDLKYRQILTKELEELRLNRVIEKSGAYKSTFGEPVHTYIVPIRSNGMFKGAIMMNTNINEIREPLRKVYEIIWLCAIFAIFISSFIIYHLSQKIIVRPLAQINYVAGKIAKGEVDKRVHVEDADDEIGELAQSFNSMADALEEVEKNRREFISNVSHEVRSPITSIKGFIGGILDGVIPRDKEDYYLHIAYDEIQRLTRLVNDLLDLSAIEAGRFSMRIEELNINEIIRLTVLNFEPKINEKRLNVDVCFKEDSLYVAADRDRIIQVVTNLVDNAIKYVSDGGTVKVCTRAKGDKAYVSVFNDGPAIPKEDVKRIWDRFYKADKSRTSKMSTGLGLPIVRNILSQLGEDIWLDNKEGEGVTFTFTLKRI